MSFDLVQNILKDTETFVLKSQLVVLLFSNPKPEILKLFHHLKDVLQHHVRFLLSNQTPKPKKTSKRSRKRKNKKKGRRRPHRTTTTTTTTTTTRKEEQTTYGIFGGWSNSWLYKRFFQTTQEPSIDDGDGDGGLLFETLTPTEANGGGFRDWSSIQGGLLDLIFKHVLTEDDHSSVSSVCNNWRSTAYICFPEMPAFKVPQLVLPCSDPNYRAFFSPYDYLVCVLYLPMANGKHVCGSSQGWLILLDETSPSISVLNPFSLKQPHIELPARTTFPNVDLAVITKLVLSPNPTENNYIAMAMYENIHKKQYLAFCRPRDKEWTLVNIHPVHDITAHHCEWKFYTLSGPFGGLFEIDNFHGSELGRSPRVNCILWRDSLYDVDVESKNLVEKDGEVMLVVRRNLFHAGLIAKRFEVYLLSPSCRCSGCRWLKMDTISSYSLFADGSSVLASDFHQLNNCIYFTGKPRVQGFSIFNLTTNHRQKFCPSSLKHYSFKSQPVWLTPSSS